MCGKMVLFFVEKGKMIILLYNPHLHSLYNPHLHSLYNPHLLLQIRLIILINYIRSFLKKKYLIVALALIFPWVIM